MLTAEWAYTNVSLPDKDGSTRKCARPEDNDAVLGQATALLEQTRYQDASELLRKSPGLKCDFRVSLLLAASFEGSGDLPEVEQTLVTAHSIWPANNSIAASLAREYMSTGQVDPAVLALDHFHATPATPQQEMNVAAITYIAAHRLAAAQAIAQLAYQSHPLLETLLLLANTLQLEGRYKDVIALLQKQRVAYSRSAPFLVTLAESEYDAAIFDAARRDLEHAIELDQGLYQAHYLLGNVLLKQGDADQAAMQYRSAISLAPKQPRTYYQLALAMRATQNEAGEEAVLVKALALDSRYAEAHAEMGRILLAQSRFPEAVDQLNSAIQDNPTLEQPYNLLARAYGRLGETAEADAMAKQLTVVRNAKHQGMQVKGKEKMRIDEVAPQ